MSLFGPKKDKTPMDIIEDQLKFWRRQTNDPYFRADAVRRLIELENHILAIHKDQTKNLIPERIKSMESTIAELMFMGREGKKDETD